MEDVGHDRPATRRSRQDPEQEELLTVQEAAVICVSLDERWTDGKQMGIGPRTIRLPWGGRRYRREDLDAHIAEH
jgi:hypothetical protein